MSPKVAAAVQNRKPLQVLDTARQQHRARLGLLVLFGPTDCHPTSGLLRTRLDTSQQQVPRELVLVELDVASRYWAERWSWGDFLTSDVPGVGILQRGRGAVRIDADFGVCRRKQEGAQWAPSIAVQLMWVAMPPLSRY